jgi:hypothetical protein
MIFTDLLYEFIMLLITSTLSILFFVVFNALVIYDKNGYDNSGFNCYRRNILGEIDNCKWKYFIFQQEITENILPNKNGENKYIYNYNPFLDNLPSHIVIFLIISVNNIILLNFII